MYLNCQKNLEYINLNEAQISISQNQENNYFYTYINSNFILDKIENKIPLIYYGDHLSLNMTFISLPKNNLKNIKAYLISMI